MKKSILSSVNFKHAALSIFNSGVVGIHKPKSAETTSFTASLLPFNHSNALNPQNENLGEIYLIGFKLSSNFFLNLRHFHPS